MIDIGYCFFRNKYDDGSTLIAHGIFYFSTMQRNIQISDFRKTAEGRKLRNRFPSLIETKRLPTADFKLGFQFS